MLQQRCKHARIVKQTANAVALRNISAQNTACQTACRTACDTSISGAARALALQISRCERRSQYSAHRFSEHEIFPPMYSRGKPASPAHSRKTFHTGKARFKIQVRYGKFKISKFQSPKRSKILKFKFCRAL